VSLVCSRRDCRSTTTNDSTRLFPTFVCLLVVVSDELTQAKKRGRKTVWTEERIVRLCELLESGMSRVGACRAVGVGESTFYEKLEADAEFTERVSRAEAASESALLSMAKMAAAKDGRVAIMLLERRFPKQWGERKETVNTNVQVTGNQLLEMLAAQRRKFDNESRNHLETAQAKAIPAQCVPTVPRLPEKPLVVLDAELVGEEPSALSPAPGAGTQADPGTPQTPGAPKTEPPS
jgi:hypothetical protein